MGRDITKIAPFQPAQTTADFHPVFYASSGLILIGIYLSSQDTEYTTVGVTLSQRNTALPGIFDMPRNQSYSYCSLLTALIISSAINLDWNPILASSLTRRLRQPNTHKNLSHAFCVWEVEFLLLFVFCGFNFSTGELKQYSFLEF